MKANIYIILSYIAQFFLEWKICHKNVVEKIETHILCSVTFFRNRIGYEIMWKNTVEPGRPHITILFMRTACCVPTATDTLHM